MTKEQAQKIKEYFNKGYFILIKDTFYLDSEVKKIYEKNGELVYDSSTYTARPLRTVSYNLVIVAKPIQKELSNYYTCYECGYEWCSNNDDENLCPKCGEENIDYLGN